VVRSTSEVATPRVTVIIATYNWGTVLPYAIGSVLRQTFSDFELLVIGDGCTDESGETVARFDDPRVRWLNLSANTGHQCGPNNEGLRQARGDVIAYLGHDDLWLPHHLELQMTAIDTGADLACGITAMISPTGARTYAPKDDPSRRSVAWDLPPSGLVHRAGPAL
jgi:glycosyltransferase involved in cell wall biosynthesis